MFSKISSIEIFKIVRQYVVKYSCSEFVILVHVRKFFENIVVTRHFKFRHFSLHSEIKTVLLGRFFFYFDWSLYTVTFRTFLYAFTNNYRKKKKISNFKQINLWNDRPVNTPVFCGADFCLAQTAIIN